MTPIVFATDGKQVRLGQRIGKGGEGEVYAVDGTADRAVKFYTIADRTLREAKVRKMVADALADRFKLIAFPIAPLRDNAGRFVGFIMAKVDGSKALHELYSPGARKAAFPRADYRFLVHTAANIARAVGAAHAANCVIGDINHSGILISDRAIATLIDADSFQIFDGTRRLPCIVGVPEYTPPELQGQRLETVERTPNHDAFGLAIVVFQLLFMGRHPFSGRPKSSTDLPIEKAIREYRFAYSQKRDVGLDAPPGVPKLDDFSPQIAAAFEGAFGSGGVRERPTAKHWMALLDELEKSLRSCAANGLHYYPAAAKECPWCRMERTLGAALFVPFISEGAPTAGFNFAAANIAAIWRAIEAVSTPPNTAPAPTLRTPTVGPSAEVVAAKRKAWKPKAIGIGLLALAAGILILAPHFFFFALIAGGIGVAQLGSKPSNSAEFVAKYRDIETKFLETEQRQKTRSGNDEFLRLKASLSALKKEYDDLPTEEKRRIDTHNANRREEQLNSHLDRFQIRHYKISHVGPAKLAVLTSYGIETAADISSSRVQAVPGFGTVNSQPLLAWRRKLERGFTYNSSPTPADARAISAIRADIARRATEIKTQLSTGPQRLTSLAASIRQQQATTDPALQYLHDRKTQAIADLNYLGVPTPTVQPPQPQPTPTRFTVPFPARQTTFPAQQTTASGQAPTCPQCGGRMVLRTARRGRGTGRQFYGCARYPTCRGTRPKP
jgi:DNA-binding helix-hairpin-helix protein with protein kinase domain